MEEMMYGTYAEYRDALEQEFVKQDTMAVRMAESFIMTGYLFRKVKDTGILEQSEYENVYEFAEKEFGKDKSQVSRYIRVNMEYSEGGYSERLQERYQGYGYSKLELMLRLPAEIRDEISQDYSKAEIQEIKDEVDAEAAVTDIERILEGEEPAQKEMDNNLQKVIHQLLHDEPELFVKIWNTPEDLFGKGLHAYWSEALAPQDESCYSVRLQGIGRMMLFIKGADKDISLANIRSGEKETYSWEDMEAVIDNILGSCANDTKEDFWERMYGEPFPVKKEPVAPVQPQKQEKKPEKRKESKVTKAKKEGTKNAESRINTEYGENYAALTLDEMLDLRDKMMEANREIEKILDDLIVRPRKLRTDSEDNELQKLYSTAVSLAADAERMLNG